MRLTLLEGELAVCRLERDAAVPSWVRGPFTAAIRTPSELSVVCSAAEVPAAARAERGWSALVVAGPLDFSLTGVLAALAAPLAAAGIPIFVLSTFDTDYLLVRSPMAERAASVLVAAGHEVAGIGERPEG